MKVKDLIQHLRELPSEFEIVASNECCFEPRVITAIEIADYTDREVVLWIGTHCSEQSEQGES